MERATAVRFFDLLLLHKGCQEYWNDYKFSQKGTDLRNFPEIYNKSQKTLFFFCTFVFIFTSSCSQVSYKKAVLKNFAKFSEKYLCWSLFLNNIWKGTQKQVYACQPYSNTGVCLCMPVKCRFSKDTSEQLFRSIFVFSCFEYRYPYFNALHYNGMI